MHNQNQITASTGMDQEGHLAPDNTYASENWVDMSSFQHQTTMPDYGAGFSFISPIGHRLPSESLSRMPPPPAPQQIHQPQATHTQLPMLMMPHATWPSMLTNPSGYGPPHSAPPLPIAPIPASLRASKLPASSQPASQPRKTLTDDDRRAMCQYAEDHPTAKQTDIGARFGVERSTVSKVLRNKEKYLSEDRSSSPVKRTGKGKGADFDKALANWVRKAHKSGITVTKEMLEEKARLFLMSLASGDSLQEPLSSAWLDKFMLKHGIGPGKLTRRASETNISDGMRTSGTPSLPPSQPSSAISPASPSGHLSPSPLSANKSDEEKETMGSFAEFAADGIYKHSSSQSTTSLSSAFTDTATPSFPGSAISPAASFSFSPDPNVGTFLAGDQSRQLPPHGPGFQRPRSQTFPTLDLEYLNQPQPTEPATPKYQVASTAPSSAMDPPSSEPIGSAFSFEQAVSPPRLRHSSSSGSIAGRSATTPVTSSAVASSPGSPTQEDARRAADTLLSFIKSANGFVDHNEYLTVVRLTEKLRIHQSQLAKAAAHGMGGLSRIPEGDSEMPSAPPVARKAETTMSA